MDGKHAQKKFGATGAMAPTPLSLKTRGGGGVAYKDWTQPPPLWLQLYPGKGVFGPDVRTASLRRAHGDSP